MNGPNSSSTMPAPRTSTSDHCRTSSKSDTSSPRRPVSKPTLSEADAVAPKIDSPTQSSRTISSASSEGRSRKPGSSRRAHLSLGGTDHSKSSGDKEIKTERKKVNRPGGVSAFLRKTHRGLKDQIDVLQGHIKFVQNLATMKVEKKVDLLFRMIDKDGGGTVDAAELATAMRQNAELSFSDSIEKAIDMVATFDVNCDGELDKQEFVNYLNAMVDKLQVSVSDFAEFLIVELLMSNETPEEKQAGDEARERINFEVKKREELFAVLSSEVITEAFEMMDVDSSREVPFRKVARALRKSIPTEDSAVQESLEVLLLSDKRDKRVLDFEQFGRLMLSVSKAVGDSAEGLSEDLMDFLEGGSVLEETIVSSADESTSGADEAGAPVDSLTYERLQKLFDLWDVDGDGDISTTELANGLRKFQSASGIKVDAKVMAQALIKFDGDGNNQLDRREFANAMIVYAKQFGIEVHALIDHMCVISSSGESEVKGHKQKHGKTRKGHANKDGTERERKQEHEDEFWEK